MSHAILTLGRGHEVFGDVDALVSLQAMMVNGKAPANLDLLQSAKVEKIDLEDTSASICFGRKQDRELLVHGSVVALDIAQAWYLANPAMRLNS